MGAWDWVVFVIYYVSFVAIVIGYAWTVVLFVTGGRYLRVLHERPAGSEADYLWVFMVPALNEGVTIADSVERLRRVHATRKIILVINDGSDDDTGDVLASIAGADLEVLTRVAPNARVGKAAALNAAFEHVEQTILAKPAYRDVDPSRVIFGIVDADGRLAPEAPATVARHFDDPEVGGVQVHVHIYNQTSWLTRMQGLEFRIFRGALSGGALVVGHRVPRRQRPVQPHDGAAKCCRPRRALVPLPDRGSGTGVAVPGPWVARRT